jgi:hypothetical protein
LILVLWIRRLTRSRLCHFSGLTGVKSQLALTVNNHDEAERSLRSYMLWRKGSYGVWSHRGELFRQRILTIVESCRKLGANPLEWLRNIVRSVIEKSAYPSLSELVALSQ